PVQETAPFAPVNTQSKPMDSVAQASNQSSTQSSADTEEADPVEAWDSYGQLLHNMVSKNKVYPQIAIRRNWQGTAMVSARFNRGRLVSLVLLDPTSGHKVLDDAALEMLKKAVSALPVKGDLAKKSFTVIVPIDFKLES
ncbi:MAG: energy transducer TonB, partial [Nitrosomonadales bacterium]|nr:energy transducer TonB [Nitrosomonadales bacterium]